ncbi:LOW QUALITY PROTEIN: UBN2 domain-containing protein, partial [Cephalotus follicularis]
YELFKMQPNESIKNLYNRLLDITNGLLGLGKVFGQDELVRKLLGCLNDEWEPKRFQRKNFNKGEGSKMDPPTCCECNKLGHIKVDCPLKKKKLFKKKALKSWHLSDDESSDEEVTEQVANLCFMALSDDDEDSENEVGDSYTFGELQFAFDEL